MHRAITLTVLLLFTHPLFACLWSYGTDRHGNSIQTDEEMGVQQIANLFKHESHGYWEMQRKRTADPKADRFVRNNHAVVLMHLGKAAEAMPILEAIEKQNPGEYPTAANLGTAYELTGDNTKALRWIQESIRRNSRAHNGTEWLHVRILEAKLARAKDPRWLATHSVLGLDTGNTLLPVPPRIWPKNNENKINTIDDVKYALYYQLHERLQFVTAPEPIVADLFYHWGDLAFLTAPMESAEAFYLQAIAFGAQRPQARERLAHVQSILAKANGKNPPPRSAPILRKPK